MTNQKYPSGKGSSVFKRQKTDPFQRYRKVLLKCLYESCQAFEWSPVLINFVRNNEWGKLYAWSGNAVTDVYSTAAEHYAASQVSALVRKYPFKWRDIGLTMSPREKATTTFLDAERRCRKVNSIFKRYKRTPYTFRLEYMRRWIAHVLGETPNYRRIYQQCDFGSGSNVGVHGNATNLYRKLYAERLTVTPTALPYVRGAFKTNLGLAVELLTYEDPQSLYVCFDNERIDECINKRARLVSYNNVGFVTKTAETDRTVAAEPLLNLFVQNGIGEELRKKLKTQAYDLTDQEWNQFLAKVGSRDGSYATMDLSSASDSISVELVRYLLPEAWFDLLNDVRSKHYRLDGKVYTYHKFCSMGNGFCFPLETLIFAAAVRAEMHSHHYGDRTHAVYGDDIIVPTNCYDGLKQLLGLCGFKVNPRKSFKTGPFRESCGADWYKGQDVRPVYLDYPLKGLAQLRIFHNATLRSSRTAAFFDSVRPYLRQQTPERARFVRPHKFNNLGWVLDHWLSEDEKFITLANLNGAFDVELDEFMSSRFAKWDRSIQNWSWKEFVYSSFEDKPRSGDEVRFHRASYQALLRGSPGGRLALRRKTRVSVTDK